MKFLDNELKFPFKATIEEEEIDELEWKDIVVVKKIDDFDKIYGLLLEIRKERRKFIFPLLERSKIFLDTKYSTIYKIK